MQTHLRLGPAKDDAMAEDGDCVIVEDEDCVSAARAVESTCITCKIMPAATPHRTCCREYALGAACVCTVHIVGLTLMGGSARSRRKPCRGFLIVLARHLSIPLTPLGFGFKTKSLLHPHRRCLPGISLSNKDSRRSCTKRKNQTTKSKEV